MYVARTYPAGLYYMVHCKAHYDQYNPTDVDAEEQHETEHGFSLISLYPQPERPAVHAAAALLSDSIVGVADLHAVSATEGITHTRFALDSKLVTRSMALAAGELVFSSPPAVLGCFQMSMHI